VSAFFLNIYQILKFEFGETKHFLNTLKWRRYGAIYRPVFWGLTAGLPFNFLLPRDPSYGFERTAQLSTGRFAAERAALLAVPSTPQRPRVGKKKRSRGVFVSWIAARTVFYDSSSFPATSCGHSIMSHRRRRHGFIRLAFGVPARGRWQPPKLPVAPVARCFTNGVRNGNLLKH